MAVQIVDEPAASGMTIHPLNEADEFAVSEMVRKQGAHDEIRAPRGIEGKKVCGLESDGSVCWRGKVRRLFRPRVEVNAFELYGKVALLRPPPDFPQHIAASATDIKH